jgi:hypothetical protein
MPDTLLHQLQQQLHSQEARHQRATLATDAKLDQLLARVGAVEISSEKQPAWADQLVAQTQLMAAQLTELQRKLK